ncbi:unnamed protein product [Vitrella brassicaformis CCMP3155]|uniref:Uncharacterized protein n=1 Tax=Vitrella brassicaformis (strain CCMP3155) TaxID=1169540 RepID=A0A0G4FQY3_VITBC|nr:unnamed protein product [Vitrella brassicaformis CCMP3155]|eukprot:CEM16631.1 unnamed protein product [Vitrella brassicaformis CCMP3155]
MTKIGELLARIRERRKGVRGLSDISREEIWAHIRSLVKPHQLIGFRLQPVNSPGQPTAARTAEAQQATFDSAARWHQADDTRDLQRPGLHLYYTLKSSNSSNSSSSSSEQIQLKCEYFVGLAEDPSEYRVNSKECLQLTNELWYVHVERKSMCFVMGITEGGREKEWDAPVDTDGKHILSLLDKEAITANRANVLYTTGWIHPCCHYRRADEISGSGVREEKWTLSPGVRCEGVPEGGGDLFHVSMAWHENLRLKFNDGNGARAAWDCPQDGRDAYVIPSLGLYIIS